MIPTQIKNADYSFEAPRDWDAEAAGHCGNLFVRASKIAGMSVMTSAWLPTPEELAFLNAGGPLLVSIVGNIQPVISLTVSDLSEIEPAATRKDVS
jgi:hypothetical protein